MRECALLAAKRFRFDAGLTLYGRALGIVGTSQHLPGGHHMPVIQNCTTHRRSGRPLATVIATGLASLALLVQAPVAGAHTTLTTSTPTANTGIIPFTGDVYSLGSEGNLIPVSITSTPLSAPLYNVAGDPMNLTWGQFSSATSRLRL
jgi:hypothetical protein